ncbi:hypothetical protein, partial [Serratia ficaria]|uniref:hypothetical protein n=1 Tax=Serratia ficaria TaxID=61651 RepID=UPI001C3F2AF0
TANTHVIFELLAFSFMIRRSQKNPIEFPNHRVKILTTPMRALNTKNDPFYSHNHLILLWGYSDQQKNQGRLSVPVKSLPNQTFIIQ